MVGLEGIELKHERRVVEGVEGVERYRSEGGG